MSRLASMTFGLVLILIGAQLYLVKSWLLTPSATRFLADHSQESGEPAWSAPSDASGWRGAGAGQPGQSWPFYQSASTPWSAPARTASASAFVPPGYQHRLVLPDWLMWPALFTGTVFFLHGLALRS